jgi:uncharacterized RDD family membrane protein YckC
MPPSEPSDSVSGPRRLPTIDDFPRTGPFSLAAPAPRFGARALDLALVATPALVVLAVTARTINGQLQLEVPFWLGPAVIALGVLYELIAVARWGRTLGKVLLGLRVVRYTDGARPTPVQALLRALVPWSMLALPIGPFAVGLFLVVYGSGVVGALHRGVPDQAGGTLVISTR